MGFAETADLVARFTLEDRFSASAGRITGSLGKLDSKLGSLAKSNGFLQRSLSTGFGVGLERLAEKGIRAVFSAIDAGEASLQKLELAMVQTGAVIKSTGGIAGITAGEVRNLAEKYENLNSVIDDKVIQSGENLLLTFTNINKKAFEPALQAALDLNQALGGGEAGLQGTIIQVGKALQDPIRGLTALRRVGVSFTKDQETQIKALVKSNDLYGAQQIILAELAKEFGGSFAAAGNTAAGATARLHDKIEDLQTALAKGLEPALISARTKIADFLDRDDVKAKAEEIGRVIGELGSKIVGALSDPKVIGAAGQLFGLIADKAKAGAEFANDFLLPAIRSIGTTAQTAWSAIPDGIKDLLVKGVIADRVVKFTFGVSPIEVVGSVVGDALGQFARNLLARGSSPINPLFVQQVGGLGSGPGGIPGGPATGLLGLAAFAASAVAATAALVGLADFLHNDFPKIFGGKSPQELSQDPNSPLHVGPTDGETDILEGIKELPGDIADGVGRLFGNQPTTDITSEIKDLGPTFDTSVVRASERTDKANTVALGAFSSAEEERGKQTRLAFITAASGTNAAILAQADHVVSGFENARGPWYDEAVNQNRTLDALKAAQLHFQAVGDTVTAAKLGADIARMEAAIKVHQASNDAHDDHIATGLGTVATTTAGITTAVARVDAGVAGMDDHIATGLGTIATSTGKTADDLVLANKKLDTINTSVLGLAGKMADDLIANWPKPTKTTTKTNTTTTTTTTETPPPSGVGHGMAAGGMFNTGGPITIRDRFGNTAIAGEVGNEKVVIIAKPKTTAASEPFLAGLRTIRALNVTVIAEHLAGGRESGSTSAGATRGDESRPIIVRDPAIVDRMAPLQRALADARAELERVRTAASDASRMSLALQEQGLQGDAEQVRLLKAAQALAERGVEQAKEAIWWQRRLAELGEKQTIRDPNITRKVVASTEEALQAKLAATRQELERVAAAASQASRENLAAAERGEQGDSEKVRILKQAEEMAKAAVEQARAAIWWARRQAELAAMKPTIVRDPYLTDPKRRDPTVTVLVTSPVTVDSIARATTTASRYGRVGTA